MEEVDYFDVSRQLTLARIPFFFIGTIENAVKFLDMYRFRSANDFDGRFDDDGKKKA